MAEKKKGFDLAAALGDVSKLDTGIAGREQIAYIHIDHILPDQRNFYELSGIDELAASIEFAGLQQPVRVRPGEVDGSYIIVSGHRRHAALKQLTAESQELYERFSQVPCIVERPSGQTSEVEAMLQELRLIYGNSDTRKLSSADLSKQAERVEILLYQLKEAGVEFPGKMRDHVAEACKVSASKLARLKVIRENLIPKLKKVWEAGKMTESVAYVCAQHPAHRQEQLVEYSKLHHYSSNPEDWHEYHVKERLGHLKQEKSLKCKYGTADGGCDHTKTRLAHIASNKSHWDDACENNGGCCAGCEYLCSCKDACPRLSEQITKAKAKKKADRERAAAIQAENQRPDVEPRIALWRRFGEARAAAGLSWDQYMKKADIYGFTRLKHVESYEQGEKVTINVGLPYSGGDGFHLYDVRRLCKAADVLGVSLDYLLCRADDPRKIEAIKKEVREWLGRGETPPVGKPIITYCPSNDGPQYVAAVWDGSRFHAPGKPKKELSGLAQRFSRWTLLPEDE